VRTGGLPPAGRVLFSSLAAAGLIALIASSASSEVAGAKASRSAEAASHRSASGGVNFRGSSAEGPASFTVDGSRIVRFRFANRCPGNSRAGTAVPAMALRHGRFSFNDGEFSIRGSVSATRASGRAQDVTGDCASGLLTWRAKRVGVSAPGRQQRGTRPRHSSVVLAGTGIDGPSEAELTYVLDLEKFEPMLYDNDGDKDGNCTIGYGHRLHSGPCDPEDQQKYADGWTQQMAYQTFLTDVQEKGTDCINMYVKVPLTQDQFDALTDLAFNSGCDSLNPKTSELARLLNKGQYDKVPEQIKRYVHGNGGDVIKGLITRRDDDARLFGSKSVSGKTPSVATCARDNVDVPPTAGCDRVKVQILTNFYPGDVGEGLGVGVGSVDLLPGGGNRLDCLNPANAPCVMYADFPANTKVTVTADPGSQDPDPATPQDSSFQMFTGACTGTSDQCTLTAASDTPQVDVYFIPAVVKLTLNASPTADSEMSADAEGHVAGTDPISPFYCGAPEDTMGLPCSVLVRVDGEVVVQANDEGHGKTPTFSSNCPAREAAPDYCDITLASDETVTASF
jgi:lysozyme